ncbi:MAG: exosortase/archaeosortase family protein [Gemmatimonadales bacterium]
MRMLRIPRQWAVLLLSIGGFVALFGEPVMALARDWWNDPEAGHGLLLAPAALWLAWRSRPSRTTQWRSGAGSQAIGLGILLAAVLLRYLSGLAAELFTMRMSVVLGLVGITAYYLGFRQVRAWWLPFALLALSVPLPAVVRGTITLPLQLQASRIGATLLEWRDVPVRLSGNILELPGRKLFVTEACSGLRSLTALVALSVFMGGTMLRTWIGRAGLVAGGIGIAIGVNAIRVFLTGFLVTFADPSLAEGFLHLSEGWFLFLLSLALIAIWAATIRRVERWRFAFRTTAGSGAATAPVEVAP